MWLKVGDLAKRCGVTVRALHHYDSIGLLRPSGRSEGGYRLYGRDDVARLHGIQTLRQMGVPLADVARLLDGGSGALPAMLARQIGHLDEEISRAQALRDRLGVMQFVLAGRERPDVDDWLGSVAMMSGLEQHFTAEELRRAFERWALNAADWPPLVQALRAAMAAGLAADAVEVQRLVQRWIDLALRWMEGDLELLGRWGSMLREQPGLPLPAGMDLALIDFVDTAIAHRRAVVARHFSPDVQRRLAEVRGDWRELVARGHRLMADGVPPASPDGREFARAWQALMDRTTGHDAGLAERLVAAYENEPLLQAGLPLTPALRQYVEQARGLDPHAA